MLQDPLDLNSSDPAEAATHLLTSAGSIPAAILTLESIYREEMALRVSTEERFAQLESRLRAGEHGWSAFIDVGGRTGIGINTDVLQRYLDRVTEYAKKAFSVEGAPFTGTLNEYTGELHHTVNRAFHRAGQGSEALAKLLDAYSPIRAWHAISKQHNPAAQRHAASRKAARTIRGHFGMLRGDDAAMRTVKGRVEVSISVYTTLSSRGQRVLPYGSQLPGLGEALQQAMVDSGSGAEFGRHFTGLCNEVTEYKSRPIISRERVDLGDGVDVVMGFNAFKLYLPLEIAGLINMFLAEYPEVT